jgi:hypothetical protein
VTTRHGHPQLLFVTRVIRTPSQGSAVSMSPPPSPSSPLMHAPTVKSPSQSPSLGGSLPQLAPLCRLHGSSQIQVTLVHHGFHITVWIRTIAKVTFLRLLSCSTQIHPIPSDSTPSTRELHCHPRHRFLSPSYFRGNARSSSRWAPPSGRCPPPSSPSATTPSSCSLTPLPLC